jgi:hypothetical protein
MSPTNLGVGNAGDTFWVGPISRFLNLCALFNHIKAISRGIWQISGPVGEMDSVNEVISYDADFRPTLTVVGMLLPLLRHEISFYLYTLAEYKDASYLLRRRPEQPIAFKTLQ